MKNLFLEGSKPSLEEVLQTREERDRFQLMLAAEYLLPVLAFKLNIPGHVKNNEAILNVFNKGCDEIHNMLIENGWDIVYEKTVNLPTGPEYICVVDANNPLKLKEKSIGLEETPLGRIYDIDIIIKDDEKVSSISRVQLGYTERKCFICDNSAKVCGRNRTHSVEEMQIKLSQLIRDKGTV